ncbi:biogenesis of lysosome-related organelles complex 1 subunit 3 isoform X2 [Octopus bimaculoides]|uniref:Biogenesis of lysosome-related organelles complex 1 subunit 3 n=1 Tax=Octopus bimaculoides TaxID=37653 RepID=A0A0L8HKH1_OCTBM|nr:biogenesis of lysosome-related organelles complex 1 subunit 3 isoform X2 [Octopus bimaculoides]|eukprot:XP_014771885.1 PREDICTED: biogenesis of lysosome-related organelles complex 1 subunit 3-like isoform X2 [Octopus bimaculoides]
MQFMVSDYIGSKLPNLQGIVVAGEASESDEEINTSELNHSMPTLRIDKAIPSSDNASSGNTFSAFHQQGQILQPKYNSLLHTKLRDRNIAFSRHLREALKHIYVSSTKNLITNSQNLFKTQAAIQDVSHNMRLLTNDLFRIQDKIDIITSCNILPEIKLPN